MTNYFSVKTQYDKMCTDGMLRRVTETFLFEAVSFSDAETRAYEEVAHYASGELLIVEIKKARSMDTVLDKNGDFFYRVKYICTSVDDKTGKGKKTAMYTLVQANDIKEAQTKFEKSLIDAMFDYFVEKVEETKIMEVFPLNQKP